MAGERAHRPAVQIQGGFAASVPSGRLGDGSDVREMVGYLKELATQSSPTVQIGASTGVLTGRLRRAGVDIIALELSEAHLAQLRRSLPGATAVLAEPSSLPLRTSGIGSVVTDDGGVTAAAVAEMRRVLRAGGLLIYLGSVAGVAESAQGAVGDLVADQFSLFDEVCFGDRKVTVWR